jgi:putative flavoprotein involved in K+ transport
MKLFTLDTRPGRWLVRKARAFLNQGQPLVRVKPKDLLEAGVQRVPRVAGASRGQPLLEDGRVLEVASLIWATGFGRDFRWIRLPLFDARGEPIHHRGVVQAEPGLYFVGLPFQSTLLSGLAAGAGADAQYIAGQILQRARGTVPTHVGNVDHLP